MAGEDVAGVGLEPSWAAEIGIDSTTELIQRVLLFSYVDRLFPCIRVALLLILPPG